ncbi:hypothetical protein A5821_003421 [Enterococcus sp. 7F3_DIV0205]|uniref:DUF1648 domain-containing protein n=1 Tax=Candidatus Enterococcus palustris TaxID=1834189 RepID=A0AAQ3WBI8_9ENTE|nr:hypothetical protein A5821_000229 [Enterococcus sp. 7F3_DIV0205]
MKKDLFVFLIIISSILFICLFLPSEIPVHFNYLGKADLTVHKYYLLLGSIILYSLYLTFIKNKK